MNHPLQPPVFPVALAYGALVLLFFAPHLLGLTAFPDSDFTRHFLPFSLFQQSAVLELRLSLWDPHTFSGHPFLADAQSAVFYPVSNALLVLTSFDRSPEGRLYWLQVEGAPKTVTENGMDSVVLSEFEIEATEKQFGDRVETPSSLFTPSTTSYANRQK